MCLCPRKVRNPSRRFGQGASNTFIEVPCGKCAECQAMMRQEWYIRAYSEFKEFKENKGHILFLTMTYNPNCVPILDIDNYKLKHGLKKDGIKVFDKKDIDTFRNSLNKVFERKGVTGLRYFIASEYGMSEGSEHMPHYHALIFVPKCRLSEKFIADAVQSCWKNGLAFYSDLGPFLKDENGVLYVTKYVTKDLDFFEQGDLKCFLHNKQNRKFFYRFAPRHYQSKGFGLHLAKWLLHREDRLEEFFEQGVGQEYFGVGIDRFFQIPRYIMNKILYKEVNGVRYPSAIGRRILAHMYDYRLELCDRDLRQFFTMAGLNNLIDSDDAYKIIPLHYQLEYENNFNGLRSYLFDLLGNRSIRELSLYKKVFSNCTLPSQVTAEEIRDFEAMSTERLSEFACCLYDYQLDDTSYSVSDTPWKEMIDIELFPTYTSTFKRFSHFDELLEAIQKIKSLSKQRKYDFMAEQEKIIRKLKNIY